MTVEEVKNVEQICMECGKKFMDEPPQMCCSGRECSCMGMPLHPVVCSQTCYDKFTNK